MDEKLKIAVLNHLETELRSALDVLREMVEMNSYTLNREGVNRLGKFTAQMFHSLGFLAEFVPSVDPRYGDHLVLTRPGNTARSVAMVSHLDTVFPPEEEERNGFRWQPEGDRIYGPGTLDIKGGTLMMWLVLSTLRLLAPDVFEQTDWRLFFNSSEEVLSHDFGALCRQRLDKGTLAALVFEAEGRLGEDRLVVVSRKGRATWRVRVAGRAAHAGSKHRHGANAITDLARCVMQISARTDYSRDLTFNVGTISGGAGLNRVPHEAQAEGEFRTFSPEVYQRAKEELLRLAGPGQIRSSADGFTCQRSVEILSESCPWPRNPGTDALLAVWKEAATHLRLPVEGEARGGLSDGNFLWDAVPTIDGLGPWGDNDHCSERSADGSKLPEYVEVSSFVPKAALNVLAICGLLGR